MEKNRGLTLESLLEDDIERLNRFFKLAEIDRIQPIQPVEIGEYEASFVTISVPTFSIPTDSSRNQMGQADQTVYPMIDLYGITDELNQRYWLIEVYKGENAELNARADAIVRSIYFIPRETLTP